MSGDAPGGIAPLQALLMQRHSCRAFLPDPVPEAVTQQILATAQRVPSWCNAQPWRVEITRAPQTDRLRDALYAHAHAAPQGSHGSHGVHAPDIPFPAAYTGAYQTRRRECGWALYEALGIAKGDRAGSARQMMENFRFFGAPHLALVTTEAELGAYGMLDCGAFVTAFTLAAQALGVASIPQAALAGFAPFLHDWFELPETRQILCGISFGYSDADHPANQFRTTRAPISEVVTWHD